MSGWPDHPVIYELNTAAWLHDVGKRVGTATTLAEVLGDEWDLVTPSGVDAVWLMGVWERSPAGVRLARDPFFPPWPDVAQLNAFAPGLRQAAIDTLLDIGHQADGVRCDMAMLLLNEIFSRTWGRRAGDPPPEEYWTDVIQAVRAANPGFLFVAEAYLGRRMAAPATGLRPLLRQTSL